MKNAIKLIGTIVLIFALVFTLTTCSDGGGTGKHLSGAVSIVKATGNITTTGSTFYVGDGIVAKYTGSETVTYQWKLNGANTTLKYDAVTTAPGSLTVSAARYNSKTSSPVTVIAGVTPNPDYYGSWTLNNETYTITADKMTWYLNGNLDTTYEPLYWAPFTNNNSSYSATHPTGYKLTGERNGGVSDGGFDSVWFYINADKTSLAGTTPYAGKIYTKQS
jgi:hypothetical protein